MAMALLGGAMLLATLATADTTSALVALAAATLPAPVLVSLVLAVDRFEPEPRRMLVLTFAYGATVAVLLAGILNVVGGGLVAGMFGLDDPGAHLATVSLVAPVVEETLKVVAVLWVGWRHRGELSGIIDGLVYSAMVGLGFAVTENVFYYVEALAAGQGAFAGTVVLRGVFSPFAHPLFTAMAGMGVAVAAESARWRVAPPVLGLVGAIGLHALWNAATVTGAAFVLVYLVVFVPVFGAVVLVALRTTRREERLLRTELDDEVAAGRLTAEEVDTLASLRRRRRAEREAAATSGEAGKWARRSFHHAATQLAFTRHRRRTGRARHGPDADIERFWLDEMVRRRRLATGDDAA